MGSHCYNHGNEAQGEETTVNPQYQHEMQPVFRNSSGVVGSAVEICTPAAAFSIFLIGVTQASISFKNDRKISQSTALLIPI